MRRSRVTIRDVARRAGVSVATVSRVYTGRGPVHESTRTRVVAAARELRYTPDAAARSLITRRTETLGVLLPDLYGEFFSELIRGVDRTARQHDYHLLVSGCHAGPGELGGALRAMRGSVDGLVVLWPELDVGGLTADLPEHLPVVLLSAAGHTAYESIAVDNYGGARAIVEHLLARGHRRIATIAGAERNGEARERLRGYRDALRGAGIRPRADWEVIGHFTEDGGHAAAQRLLALAERPGAIFAANDSMAIGAMSALADAGLRIPDDVAVAGFDDVPIARYTSPPLSTVHVPIQELGARAVDRLLHTIAGGNRQPRSHETLATTLVVRGSCGANTATA
ncbi:MAG TPA: LacI family DNA-binding transcriptional regulator [Gemmatimonadaceae bacterium]